MSQKSYFDYSFKGEIEISGAITEYTGVEAVANAVRAWLVSFQGEVLRRPTLGGVLVSNLIKPLTEERALIMERAIISGLRNDFTPRVVVTKISVTPVYSDDYYDIRVEGYCPAVRDSFAISESIKRLAS